MKTNRIKRNTSIQWVAFTTLGLTLLATVACSSSSKLESTSKDDKPLTSFAQEIRSDTTSLTVAAGKPFVVPVVVKNVGTAPWNIGGTYPVNLSYVWFEGGKQLPIEGTRTALPANLGAGQEQTLKADVAAPPAPGNYTLRFTMVQERVAWFVNAGGKTLDIPATVR